MILPHEDYMRRAIVLARNAPDMPFGTVIVDGKSGEIAAEGWNKTITNPLLHGEIDAIYRLAQARPETDWKRHVLYTTAEPCPMCQSAILWTGIGTVVFGTSIRFLQGLGWSQIDIVSEEVVRRAPFGRCVLVGGVLEHECNALFKPVSRQA